MRFSKGLGMSVLFGALALALTASVTGCSSGGDQNAESNTGKVSMQLTGQTNGNAYRLRNAQFTVAGPTMTVLDSETDLTATTLNATLATGMYTIELQPGWSLERSDAGTFEVVDATLTSANPKAFQILGGGTTNVAFQFTTNGTVVTIGTGDLSVSIDVVENGMGGGTCSTTAQTGCPAGQACYFTSMPAVTGQCFPPGSVAIGGMCTGAVANECVSGAACGQAAGGNVCIQLCSPSASPTTCPAPKSCLDIGLGGLGVCN